MGLGKKCRQKSRRKKPPILDGSVYGIKAFVAGNNYSSASQYSRNTTHLLPDDLDDSFVSATLKSYLNIQ
jgi:hypothetical protein